MKKKFAIVSDYDNTLYFPGVGFKQADLDAISKFRKLGNYFGISSGKCPKEFSRSFKNAFPIDFGVFTSGSVIQDSAGKIILNKKINRALCKQIINSIKKYTTTIAIHANQQLYMLDDFLPHIKPINSIDDIEGEDFYGVSAHFSSPSQALEISEIIRKKFEGKIQSFVNVDDVDIVNVGSSKGKSLSDVLKLFDADISVAIGDSYNDLPLIESANIGFLLDIADENIKHYADYIVESVAEAIDILLKDFHV